VWVRKGRKEEGGEEGCDSMSVSNPAFIWGRGRTQEAGRGGSMLNNRKEGSCKGLHKRRMWEHELISYD